MNVDMRKGERKSGTKCFSSPVISVLYKENLQCRREYENITYFSYFSLTGKSFAAGD